MLVPAFSDVLSSHIMIFAGMQNVVLEPLAWGGNEKENWVDFMYDFETLYWDGSEKHA